MNFPHNFFFIFLILFLGNIESSIAQFGGAPPNSSHINENGQIWSVTQGGNDFIYLGGNNKVFEYDGNSWKSYDVGLGAKFVTRGVDDLIYVGGNKEFGRLIANELGQLKYELFVGKIDSTALRNLRIERVFSRGDGVYYFGATHLFIWKNDSLYTKAHKGALAAAFSTRKVHEDFYCFNYNAHLCVLVGDSLKPLPNAKFERSMGFQSFYLTLSKINLVSSFQWLGSLHMI